MTDPDNVEAECGIIVRSDLKGTGLGSRLFDAMVRYAKAQGVQRLVAIVPRQNGAMLALARRFGFVADASHPRERETLRLVLPLQI